MKDSLAFKLPGTGQMIKTRALSTEQMDLLASNKPYHDVADVLSQLIVPECLGLSYETYEKFLLGDHLSCLVAIRRATWGDVFDYALPCPKCQKEHTYRIDLSELPIKWRDPDQPLRGMECVFTDAEDNITEIIIWKNPTVADSVQKITEHREFVTESRKKQNYQLTFTTAMHIQDILVPKQGIENFDPENPEHYVSRFEGLSGFRKRDAIRRYITKTDASWTEEFYDAIADFDSGVEVEVDHDCLNPDCSQGTFKALLPIEETFFASSRKSSRPSTKSRKGKVRAPWKKKGAASPETSKTTIPDSSSEQPSTSSPPTPSSPESP